MQVRKKGSYLGGHTEIELFSDSCVYPVGTFCAQIPPQILGLRSEESFEIPDEFMNKELNLESTEDPVAWFKKKHKELGHAASAVSDPNNVFDPFFDAIAKFCNYDRKRAMQKRG